MKVKVTKEIIKAIRICTGWKTDLRCNIEATAHDNIEDFVDKNYVGLFGYSAYSENVKDIHHWCRHLKAIADCVCRGFEDDV